MESPTPLRLYLVRHGQVAANREYRYIGRRDDRLTELGRRQAEGLGQVLSTVGAQRLLSSPRRRALETAEPVGRLSGLEAEVDERLREQAYGEWEGLTRDEVRALGSDHGELLERFHQDSEVKAPGGESVADVQARVESLVEELYQRARGGAPRSGSVVLVSHVGPIKALLGSALELPMVRARRLFLDPGTVSVIDWGKPPTIRLFNAHSHLGWENARWMQSSPALAKSR